MLTIAANLNAINIISGPYLQNVSDTEATIVWRTDKDALSWVEIAPNDGMNFYAEERPRYYATNMGRAVIGKVHKVRIKKLDKNTTYRYRIFSKEVIEADPYFVQYGKTASTSVYGKAPLTFSTRNDEGESLNFLVVNDIHGDTAKLRDLMADFKKGETDFVLFNGDMVSYMNSEQQLFDGFIDKAVNIFASETPFYMVRGNHESRGLFAMNYMDYFPTASGQPYYSMRIGPIFFIMLDGGEDKPDNDIEYSETAFGDAYRAEQAEWLSEVVKSDEFKNAPFRVVVAHVPPVGDTWHGPLHAKALFVPILNEAGIDLMLCGHLHRHKYLEPGSDGANFPVLINSNTEALKINVDRNNLNVAVKSRDGKEVKSFHYKAQK